MNTSSSIAYHPQIFTKNLTPGIRIANSLDEFDPIQPQEKIEIEISYCMRFEGTANEADAELKRLESLPPEMQTLELIITYQDETESKYCSIFNIKRNQTKNRRRKPRDFAKLELPAIMKLRRG